MPLDDNDFVDLYEVLDVEPGTEPTVLRNRIAELYIEAKDNLNHQGHRKRFYFRELYEIHLPHARHILLDSKRREKYDEELKRFVAKRGRPFTPHRPRDSGKAKTDALPASAPAKSEAETQADDFAEFADLDAYVAQAKNESNSGDKGADERRQDYKRRELIKQEIIANGFKWGVIGGIAAFLGSTFVFLILHAVVPGGITANSTFVIGSLALVTAATVIGNRQSTRWARKTTVGYLSKLSYEELLRVCAQ